MTFNNLSPTRAKRIQVAMIVLTANLNAVETLELCITQFMDHIVKSYMHRLPVQVLRTLHELDCLAQKLLIDTYVHHGNMTQLLNDLQDDSQADKAIGILKVYNENFQQKVHTDTIAFKEFKADVCGRYGIDIPA